MADIHAGYDHLAGGWAKSKVVLAWEQGGGRLHRKRGKAVTPNPTFEFTHAITRRPSSSVANGLRAVDTGPPVPTAMLAAHAQYVAALRRAGAQVIELEPLEAFPDSVFVEDTALCLPATWMTASRCSVS